MRKKTKPSRKIHIISEISEETFLAFCKRLSYLERQSSAPITIELSSPGGGAYDALAFSARIRSSPCQIIVRAYGLVASAAVLVLAAGNVRKLAAEAWVMVHEDSGTHSGTVTDLKRESGHIGRLEDQWSVLLEKVTKTSAATWRQLHHDSTYLTAAKCLELGLVDEIF